MTAKAEVVFFAARLAVFLADLSRDLAEIAEVIFF